MRASFLASLVIASVTFVSAAPLEARVFTFPTVLKGGNAQSGISGNVDGGSTINLASYKIDNGLLANTGGNGGLTESGTAIAGSGTLGGGIALSGNTGSAYGGDVGNQAAIIVNGIAANQGGHGGTAVSGTAIGGNAVLKRTFFFPLPKGGNAQSGISGNVDGGSTINQGGLILNTGPFANTGGNAGVTESGTAIAGSGIGGGGIALSGNTGSAYGGDVGNSGYVIVNGFKANTGGNGGVAVSGTAIGGNAILKRTFFFPLPKGGNAQSGISGNVDGGNVINSAGAIFNGAFANTGGNAGVTESGTAIAGSGIGGGGIALSGNTGSAYGGSVENSAGLIVNGFKANTGGNGGVAISGTAIGGNAII